MRIVDRKTFLELPRGTVYAKFAPAVFEELQIKGDTLDHGDDWFYQDLIPPPLSGIGDTAFFSAMDRMMEGQPSGPLAWHCQARDGCFDDDQLFAVFDLEDCAGMIARLLEATTDQQQFGIPNSDRSE